jgi:hypothetical protein
MRRCRTNASAKYASSTKAPGLQDIDADGFTVIEIETPKRFSDAKPRNARLAISCKSGNEKLS